MKHPASAYSDLQKLEAVARELKMRRSVYPRWVAIGKLTQKEADYQLDIFEQILADYELRAKDERLL